ncbi:DUF2752 domain-containing protein [Flavobacterium quisquiliarum]|uniref:DUF2752 domain-containing protein n=1 Tax=Flavobacterium quisquiliarum TaxID=1834436 RepID=A0ABV8W8J4_9FLAO|nr:DUF2752 domain-containing protein [Flavobacterium quisquiliarum]MBW1656287.1 DUF2752 domain-containing protein [Flavobacterium quisquiliarum]NWL02130.1 hypothetical protein [Flavobacterium collinsii]
MTIEKYMIPCLFKTFFGFECLGCGFQRSLFLLFQGEFLAAFKMYPAIYSCLLLFAFAAFHYFDKSKKHKKLVWGMAGVNLIFMLGGYYFKHF